MRKTPISLLFLLVIVVSLFPITRVQAIVAFTDGFEDSTFNKWDGNGVTSWIIGSIGHTGDKSAQCTETQDGDLKSDDIDLSGATGASLDMWIQKDDTEGSEFILYYWNGATYDQIVDLDSLGADDIWINYQVDIASDYWISDFHLRIWGYIDKNENGWIDDVVVNKVEGGTNHYATASQTLSWTGNNYRDWTLKRTFSQAVSFSSDSSRTWSLTRTLTQAFSFNSNVGRTWDLSRTASQSITFTSNALADLLRIIQRTASLALNFVSNISRSWTLARGVIQTIYIDSYAGRTWNTSRTVTQSITFNPNALATILSLIQRTASLGLNLIVNSSRTRNLTRTVSQSITFTSNAIGDLLEFFSRTATLTLNFASNVFSEWTHDLWGLLDIVVKTLAGEPIENAVISAWQLNGTESFGAITDSEGYIPTQNLTKGNYTILATKEGYLTNNTLLQFLQDKIVEIRLMSVEEGTMIINEFNSALLGIQAIAMVFSVLYYTKLRGRWEFSIVCAVAWIVSCLTVFGADTGNWPTATFYFLMFMLFTLETYHEVIAEIDFRDNPW